MPRRPARPSRRRRRAAAPGARALLALSAVALGLTAAAAVALALVPGENAVDRWGFSAFSTRLQSPELRGLSDLGLAPVTIAVAALAALGSWRRDRLRALSCIVGPALAVVLAEVFKPVVGRRFEGALSWPSGTTAAVTAVVTVIVLVTRGGGRVAAAVFGATVVLLEVVAVVAFRWHYLTDALGGVFLGLGTVTLVDGLLHRFVGKSARGRGVP